MKVLHVMPGYLPAHDFGGPVKTVHELCAALVKKGTDVTVFTTNIALDNRPDIEPGKLYKKDGVKVTYYRAEFPKSYCYSRQLTAALKRHIPKFDIVHIHSVYRYTTLAAAGLCAKLGKPYILNPFGALDPAMINLKSRFRKMVYIKFIEKRNIDGAAAIHAASVYEKEAFLSLGFRRPIAIIPPGLDIEEYSRPENLQGIDKKFPFLKDKKIILFLGRIHPKKGLDLLARSFKAICAKRNDVCLVIAGSGEEKYVRKIKALFENMELAAHVLFTGMLLGPEKLTALHGSDIFILPSYGENFGIAVLEAMACRLPVVITDKVGLSADVKKYRSGIVTGYSQKEISDSMLTLLDDAAARKTMGENGRKLAEDGFTNDAIADNVMRIYRDILKT